MSKPIGADGLALIKRFEGCRLKAYKPVPTEKYWTIGWGHYGPDVREGQTITVELTWGAQPKQDTTTSATQDQSGSNNYYSSDDMQDLFNYFFGQYGGRRGNGTAA